MYRYDKIENFSLLPERCKTCQYHGFFNSAVTQPICQYALIEKKSRGCKADENCTKYKPGKRIKLEMYNLF